MRSTAYMLPGAGVNYPPAPDTTISPPNFGPPSSLLSPERQAIVRLDFDMEATPSLQESCGTHEEKSHYAKRTAKRKMDVILSYSGDGLAKKKKKRCKQHNRAQSDTTASANQDAIPTRMKEEAQHTGSGEEKYLGHCTKESDRTVDILAKQLRDACDEVTQLRSALKQVMADSEAHHMRVRQDMLLDAVTSKDKAEKKLDRERCRWLKTSLITKSELESRIKTMQSTMDEDRRAHDAKSKADMEVISRQTAQLATERSRYLRKVSELSITETEVEHCRAMLKSTNEDLAELQRIENEDRAAREKRNQGLPPPYGSLDDVECLPPHGRHEDGGSTDLTDIRQTVRNRFIQDLRSAQESSDALRVSSVETVRETAGGELLRLATIALAQACRSLLSILGNAELVDTGQRCQAQASKRSIIANRIAKLIIDFGWRLLACFDIRPLEVHLSATVKAEVGTCLRAADDALLAVLEVAYYSGEGGVTVVMHDSAKEVQAYPTEATGTGHTERMNELQYFLTLINALCLRFDKLAARDLMSPTFIESHSWLMENVETERRLAANTQNSPTQQLSLLEETGLGIAPPPTTPENVTSCSRTSPSEVTEARGFMDQRHSGPETAPSNPENLVVAPVTVYNRDGLSVSSHIIASMAENAESGTAVPITMSHPRGRDGSAEGATSGFDMGTLDELFHVLVSQDAWSD